METLALHAGRKATTFSGDHNPRKSRGQTLGYPQKIIVYFNKLRFKVRCIRNDVCIDVFP